MSPSMTPFERLRRLPLGVLRRECLDAIEREGELDVHRLLGPQRAVVVENRDTLGRRHEIGSTLPRRSLDEVDDGPSGGTVVPRRQRVGRGSRCGWRLVRSSSFGRRSARLEQAAQDESSNAGVHVVLSNCSSDTGDSLHASVRIAGSFCEDEGSSGSIRDDDAAAAAPFRDGGTGLPPQNAGCDEAGVRWNMASVNDT
jgi:hypothetical protein